MTYKLEYVNAYGKSVVFSPASGYILSDTRGLTSNTIKTVNSQGINQIGGTLQGQSVQPRIITCRGTLLGDSTAGRKRLIDVILPGIPATLIYDDTWKVDVVPKITPDITRHKFDAQFDFSLEAAYPYFRGIKESLVDLSYIEPKFKFPWNLTKPWRFGERVAPEFTNVFNSGNVPTTFTIVFFATTAADNPSVAKAKTLETIKINRMMAAGETITVENSPSRISAFSNIDGVVTDIFNDIDFDSVFFLLDIGDNVLRYDADTNRTGLDVRIIYSTTSTGAYSR